jgi:hypothetical protein
MKATVVVAPVTVRFGEFTAAWYSPFWVQTDVDDGIDYPWAVIGQVRLVFRIGKAQVTKRVRAKVTTFSVRGFSLSNIEQLDMPTEWEKSEMLAILDAEIVRLIERHGIEAPTDIVWDIDPEVRNKDADGLR